MRFVISAVPEDIIESMYQVTPTSENVSHVIVMDTRKTVTQSLDSVW